MTWGRIDDHADEDTAHLSDKAFRLFWSAIPFCNRHKLDGVLTGQKLKLLCRQQGIPDRTVRELVDDPTISWERDGDLVRIRAWIKYKAPTSAERMQRHRKRHSDADGDATVTSHVTQDVTPSLVRAPGIPKPVPVPRTESVAKAPDSAPRPVIVGAKDPVGAYVEACRELGLSDPDSRIKGRVGAEAKRLVEEGKRPELVLEAVRELARRNSPPTTLGYIVGDIERRDAGVPQGRARPNPIDERIRGIGSVAEILKARGHA